MYFESKLMLQHLVNGFLQALVSGKGKGGEEGEGDRRKYVDLIADFSIQ